MESWPSLPVPVAPTKHQLFSCTHDNVVTLTCSDTDPGDCLPDTDDADDESPNTFEADLARLAVLGALMPTGDPNRELEMDFCRAEQRLPTLLRAAETFDSEAILLSDFFLLGGSCSRSRLLTETVSSSFLPSGLLTNRLRFLSVNVGCKKLSLSSSQSPNSSASGNSILDIFNHRDLIPEICTDITYENKFSSIEEF